MTKTEIMYELNNIQYTIKVMHSRLSNLVNQSCINSSFRTRIYNVNLNMKNKFKKGQLVAVRDKEGCRPDCRKWYIRRYLYYDDQIKRHAVVPVNGQGGTFAWDECVPAEYIWPDIFLDHDKDIINSYQ